MIPVTSTMPMYKGKQVEMPWFSEIPEIANASLYSLPRINKFYIETIKKTLTEIAYDKGALALDKDSGFQKLFEDLSREYTKNVSVSCKDNSPIDCYHKQAEGIFAKYYSELDSIIKANLLEYGKFSQLFIEYGYQTDQLETFEFATDSLTFTSKNITALNECILASGDKSTLSPLITVQDSLDQLANLGGELNWREKLLLSVFGWLKPVWRLIRDYQKRQDLAKQTRDWFKKFQKYRQEILLKEKKYGALLSSFGISDKSSRWEWGADKIFRLDAALSDVRISPEARKNICWVANNLTALTNWLNFVGVDNLKSLSDLIKDSEYEQTGGWLSDLLKLPDFLKPFVELQKKYNLMDQNALLSLSNSAEKIIRVVEGLKQWEPPEPVVAPEPLSEPKVSEIPAQPKKAEQIVVAEPPSESVASPPQKPQVPQKPKVPPRPKEGQGNPLANLRPVEIPPSEEEKQQPSSSPAGTPK